MPDYSANCFKGCGRTAVVIEGDERFCAKCWMHLHLLRSMADETVSLRTFYLEVADDLDLLMEQRDERLDHDAACGVWGERGCSCTSPLEPSGQPEDSA